MNFIFHASLKQYSINTRNPCVRVHTHTHKDDREDVTSIQTAFTGAISALDFDGQRLDILCESVWTYVQTLLLIFSEDLLLFHIQN